MPASETINAFILTLSELEARLIRLSKLLVLEQDALSAQNVTSIEDIAQQKLQLTTQIDQFESERKSLCEHLQIGPDKKSLQNWLARQILPEKPLIVRLWKNISYYGQKCSAQNRLNGIMVAHMERHTREALHILRGAIAEPESYSNRGAHDAGQSKQIIAKA